MNELEKYHDYSGEHELVDLQIPPGSDGEVIFRFRRAPTAR